MSKRYFKSTDGRVTVFRASDTRDYQSAAFVSVVDDAGTGRIKGYIQFSGASADSFLGGWPATGIDKAEYERLIAIKRRRTAGSAYSNAPRDSWIANRELESE